MGDRGQFGKVLEKCQNYRFFDIFLDILHKIKENLGQERVKRGLLSFQGNIGTISPDSPREMTVFSVLFLLFCLSLLKTWLTHLHKVIFLK